MADVHVTAVERALFILETLAERSGMTNADLTRRLKLPRSSASYILRTLERHGYLKRDVENGRYRLGMNVLRLNRAVLTKLSLVKLAVPILQNLTEKVQLSTCICMIDGDEAVFVDKVDTPGMKLEDCVGSRMEIHATAVGKLLMAYLPDEEIRLLLREHGLPKWTSKTITTRAKFLDELKTIRLQGYAFDDQEFVSGVRCIAAPVLGIFGSVDASVGLAGDPGHLDYENTPRVAKLVRDAADLISGRLAHRQFPQQFS